MKGGYLGETPPHTKFSCGAFCLECLVHPKGFLYFKVRLKSPPLGRLFPSTPDLSHMLEHKVALCLSR